MVDPERYPAPAREFERNLGTLFAAVNERLQTEARFAGLSARPVESAACQEQFGRVLVAVYLLGLEELLEPEFRTIAGAAVAHGLGAGYPGRMLDAWELAVVSHFGTAVAEWLAVPLRRLRARLDESPVLSDRAGRGLEPGASRLLELVLDGRRRDATEFLLAEPLGPADLDAVLDRLLVPVLTEVGRRWQVGVLTAAQEHAATEVCRYAVLRLIDSHRRERPNGRRALVACAPGEEHALAAEALAGYLDLRGWDVRLVGRSAPAADIAAEVARQRSDAAFFSVTMVGNLPGLVELLRSAFGELPGLRVVVGGRAALLAERVLAGERVAVVRTLAAAHAAGVEG